MMSSARTTTRGAESSASECIVMSLTGERLGLLGHFVGDRFSVERSPGRTVWISNRAIYLEHPMYVELVCLAEGLGRYIVDPPP